MNILPIGNTEASSADFTVSVGQPVTLFMTSDKPPGVDFRARVLLQIKSSSGEYFTHRMLDHASNGISVTGAGTYRVHRVAHDEVQVGIEANGATATTGITAAVMEVVEP